jgi:hypothetical protein
MRGLDAQAGCAAWVRGLGVQAGCAAWVRGLGARTSGPHVTVTELL